jgi:hypothetical protein
MTAEDARVALLRAELLRDWEAVKQHCEIAHSVDPRTGRANEALVALSLDHAYQAFEEILLRIERSLDLPARSGDSWHRRLLSDSARALPGCRPPVYPPTAERNWTALLGFRHFLRHAYQVRLDPERLAANVQQLNLAVDATEPYLQTLIAGLAPVS